MSIKPCTYPRCEDINGNPKITTLGWCESCQRRSRRTLVWLVLDWVNLITNLPTPKGGRVERRETHKVFGHPAEWASDMAARIATVLNETHDSLSDELHQTPPPHPTITDRIKVRASWRYLECRIDELAKTTWGAEVAQEINELHREVRSKLGLTRPRQILPIPCPQCELKTVARIMDFGIDQVQCETCGYTTDQQHYGLLAAMILDSLIASETPARTG